MSCLCYVCGGRVEADEIEAHVVECESQVADLEAGRRPVAAVPQEGSSEEEIDNWNRSAKDVFERLPPACMQCGARFILHESLETHEYECKLAKMAEATMRDAAEVVREGEKRLRFVEQNEMAAEDIRPSLETRQPIWRDTGVCGMKALEIQHAGAAGKTSSACDGADGREPLGAVCHVCGRVCLVNSLQRHIRQCTTSWQAYQLSRPVHVQAKRPPAPPTATPPPPEHSYYASQYYRGLVGGYARDPADDRAAADAANAAAELLLRTYNEEARRIHATAGGCAECWNCGRVFADPEKRDKHQARCAWPHVSSGGAPDDLHLSDTNTACPEEHTALCPICGKYALLGSLLRHLDQCEAQWDRRQETRAIEFRRPAPPWPDLPVPHEPGDHVKQWNAAVRARRSQRECPGCPRSFARSKARRNHAAKCCPDLVELLSDGSDSDSEKPPVKAWGLPPTERPDPTVLCFICGRRFGSASINSHMLGCQDKWERENESLPLVARRTLKYPPRELWPPPVGDVRRLAEYNEHATQLYRDASFVSCPKCARSFAKATSRDKHMRDCCPDELGKSEIVDAYAVPSSKGANAHPMCHICGQSVMATASFRWHLRKCRTRWKAENALEPKHRRRPFPKVPLDAKIPDASFTADQVRAWNRAVRAAFESSQHSCPNLQCLRSFAQLAQLRKHMTSCCPDLLKAAQDQDRLAMVDPPNAHVLGIPCHICGRRVLSQQSLPFHFSCCLKHYYAYEDEVPAAEQQALPSPPVIQCGDAKVGEVGADADEGQADDRDDRDDDDDEDENYSDDEDFETSTNKGLVLLCYTCGSVRETEATISAHLVGCRARWTRRERLRPRPWRRALPTAGFARLPGPLADAELIATWTKEATIAHQVSQSVNKCENCGRTFSGRDRLEVHKKGCQPEPKCRGCGSRFEKGPRGEAKLRAHERSCEQAVLILHAEAEAAAGVVEEEEEDASHRGVCCHLCGRRCLLPSFAIHVDRCREKWIHRERAERIEAADERGEVYVEVEPICPPDPPTYDYPTTRWSRERREAYSAESEAIYRRNSPTCGFCGRVFAEKSQLLKHQVGSCPNLEWSVFMSLAGDGRDASAAFSRDSDVAKSADTAMREWVGRRTGVSKTERIRVERVTPTAAGLRVVGGAYGFRTTREATVARERWRSYDDEHFEEDFPFPSAIFTAARMETARHRSSVSELAGIPVLTLAAALEVGLAGTTESLTRGKNGTTRRNGGPHGKTLYSEGPYGDGGPFLGRVRTCPKAYRRRVEQDEREKRNRQLAKRLDLARCVVRTRETHKDAPKHCHAAVNRRKDAREIRRYNEKIGRALTDIYSNPRSRLEEHGVEALNLVDKFADRTAVYADADYDTKLAAHTNEVPKEMALAQCNACGVRVFFGVEGSRVHRCDCGAVYCDATCCAVDAPAHAFVCMHATGRTGRSWPAKMAKYWVESRATVVARRLLRRVPKPTVEEVMREVARTRAAEEALAPPKRHPIDTTGITKRRINDHHPAASLADENRESSDPAARWLLDSDLEKDAAADRIRERLAREDAVNAQARRLREANKNDDKAQEHRAEIKAKAGSIEERIAKLDEQALDLALQRRAAIDELHATQARDQEMANQPRRAGTTKAQLRQQRLAAEADEIRHPRATARDVGAFYHRQPPGS